MSSTWLAPYPLPRPETQCLESRSPDAVRFWVACCTMIPFIFFATVLGQTNVPQPIPGYQIGNVGDGVDIILPLSISQCEPILIYYNNTHSPSQQVDATFVTPDLAHNVLDLLLPPGAGYLDWICNIPRDYNFNIFSYGTRQSYTVQPGVSSACLGLTTSYESYPYANYYDFQSYIQNSSYTSLYFSFGQ